MYALNIISIIIIVTIVKCINHIYYILYYTIFLSVQNFVSCYGFITQSYLIFNITLYYIILLSITVYTKVTIPIIIIYITNQSKCHY